MNGIDVPYREPVKKKPTTECTASLVITPSAFRRRATGKYSPAFDFQTELEQAAQAVAPDSFVDEINRLAKELNPVSEIQEMLKEFQPLHLLDDSISNTVKELHSAPLRELRELTRSLRL